MSLLVCHDRPDSSYHRRAWMVETSGAVTREWLLARGVPEELAAPTMWADIGWDTGATLKEVTREGQALAQHCPGVVFRGTDLRGPGSPAAPLWRWQAMPGPQTPRLTDASDRGRPAATDGVCRADGSKVMVWAFRANRPEAPEPVGYHLAAGVFDDTDAGPGMSVIGWLPLGPRPEPAPVAAAPRPRRR